MQKRYSGFIKEVFDLRHMEKKQNSKMNNPQNFYRPHTCVFKKDSSTKQRPFGFDSAKPTYGFSLNDYLKVGLKLRDEIFDIFIRFRFFKVAMSADVAKIHCQVVIQPCDRKFHSILWRFSGKEVETSKKTCGTYGVANRFIPFDLHQILKSLKRHSKIHFSVFLSTLKDAFFCP